VPASSSVQTKHTSRPPASLIAAAPGHAVSVSSASKEYLLPGARVGYVLSTNADFTESELDQGDYFRAREHLEIADRNAREAYRLSPRERWLTYAGISA